MTRISGIVMVLCLVFCEGLAQAVPYDRPKLQLPEPRGYVSDHAQIIDGDWKERIRSVCQDLERKTGVEMVVVTVSTIKPFGSANEYATALYEKWGIGSTQQEHGVLVLVAVQERQAAVTLGRQMLPVITPTVMNQVGHEYLQPSIELGHFGEGLYRSVVVLAAPAQNVRVGLSRSHISKVWASGSLSSPASGRSLSSGGSADRIFAIPIDGFKRVSIGEQGREDSVGTSEGSGEEQVEKDFGSVAWSSPVREMGTLGQCSFDARNRGSTRPHYL